MRRECKGKAKLAMLKQSCKAYAKLPQTCEVNATPMKARLTKPMKNQSKGTAKLQREHKKQRNAVQLAQIYSNTAKLMQSEYNAKLRSKTMQSRCNAAKLM